MDRWSEDVVENIKKDLTGKQYPEDVSKDEKRNLRKRAKDFVLLQGNLYYKCKKKWPNSNGHRYQRRQTSSFSGMKLVTCFCMRVE